SGNIASNLPQRWSAQPFSLSAAATITEIDIHGFYPAGNEPQNIVFVVWSRNGNTGRLDPAVAVAPDCGPSDAVCATSVGACPNATCTGPHMEAPGGTGFLADQLFTVTKTALVTGETDPRGGFGGALFRYSGFCIALNPGDYYLTVYADQPRAGNTSGIWNFAWF